MALRQNPIGLQLWTLFNEGEGNLKSMHCVCFCRYVNAKWYFEDVANAVEAAKEEIFITDWWFVLLYLDVDQLSLLGRSRQCGTVRRPYSMAASRAARWFGSTPKHLLVLYSKAFSGGLAAKAHA